MKLLSVKGMVVLKTDKLSHALHGKAKSNVFVLNSFKYTFCTISQFQWIKSAFSKIISKFFGGNLISSFVQPMPKDKQVSFLTYYKLQADIQLY